MDDSRFDDIIKKKIGDHEEPGFDPAALAALHQQLPAINLSPWYFRYASQLWMSAGFLLSTVIIISMLWYKDNQSVNMLSEKIISFQEQANEITKLHDEIKYLKTIRHDTVRVVEIREQPSALYLSLLMQMEGLKAELELYRTERLGDGVNTANENGNYLSSANSAAELTAGNVEPHDLREGNLKRIIPHQPPDKKRTRASWTSKPVKGEATHALSAKTIRDIQKHYSKGIGIKIGPVAEPSRAVYAVGKGSNTVGVGAMIDFILSPSISLETGVKYTHRFYEITNKNETTSIEFPGLDKSLGDLQRVDIDNRILDFPLNLKYRYPLTLKTQWVGAFGYSALLYLRQDFEYNHAWSGGPKLSILSTYRRNGRDFYSGTLNFSLGLGHELKKKRIFETSIYYQMGLGSKGLEKTNASFIGLRGAYWFTVR